MSRRGRKRGDGLSDEDRRLWEQVARSVTPLVRGPAGEGDEPAEDAAETPPEPAPPAAGAARCPASPAATPRARPRIHGHGALEADAVHGIDRRTAQRFRRGQLPIDGHLDLHGMTRERAHGALNAFLGRAQERGWRCVVVVTGKGQRGPLEPHTGVLKATLPRWLNEPGLRHRILAFAPARPQHGGGGAFYVLLKRTR